jgi:outer membrane receptor protein involved in Fe transport
LPGLPELTTVDDYINSDVTTSPREDDVALWGATFTFDTSAGSFVLSGSDYDHDIDFTFDSTPILLFFGVPAVGITNQPQSYNIKMLEGRFASSFNGAFNFVAGAYYQKEKQNFEVHVTSTDGNGGNVPWDPLDSNDFFAGGTAIFGRFRQDEIEQKALFGEATYDFTDHWQIKAGLRWFDVDLTSIQGNTHNFFGGANTPAGEIIGETVNGNKVGRIKGSEDHVTPMAALTYFATEDVLLYGLYSEGYRTGGVNNSNQPFAPGIPPVFESDKLQNYELGIKSQFLDNRMQLNATLFHIDWSDIQVEPRDPAGNIPFTVNGGTAEINGMEWGLTSLLTDSLRLNFTGTWFFKHELTEDQPVLPGASPFVITGLKGDDIPNVPELQLYVSLQYDRPIGDMLLSLIGDVTYRGKTNTEFRTDNPFNIKLDSYTQVDLFANLNINENFVVGAYVKNLGNEVGIIDGIGTFQDPAAVIALRPRTWGLRFIWRMH